MPLEVHTSSGHHQEQDIVLATSKATDPHLPIGGSYLAYFPLPASTTSSLTPPSFPLPIWDKLPSPQDFTGGSDGKVSDYNAGDPEVQSLGGEDPLEKEMATDSSTLAWKIPWTEDPDRLQSMGLQRVGHDWATSLFLSISPQWALAHRSPLRSGPWGRGSTSTSRGGERKGLSRRRPLVMMVMTFNFLNC